MKGASPVTRKRQVEAEIEDYLTQHLTDSPGALRVVLLRHIEASPLLLNNLDQPALVILAGCVQRVLDSNFCLKDFVCDVDVEWGRMFGERPHFDRESCAPDPDDPYTLESVRASLSLLIEKLAESTADARR